MTTARERAIDAIRSERDSDISCGGWGHVFAPRAIEALEAAGLVIVDREQHERDQRIIAGLRRAVVVYATDRWCGRFLSGWPRATTIYQHLVRKYLAIRAAARRGEYRAARRVQG